MSAKAKRSIKLIEQLTPKQQAAMCFEYLAEQNATEAKRVHDAVPWVYGRFKEAGYTDWRDWFIGVVNIWTTQYWRLSTLYATALLVAVENEAAEDVAMAEAQAALSRINALQAALKALCEQHGFSYHAAVKFAGVPEAKPESSPIDDDYFADWLSTLNECLPA